MTFKFKVQERFKRCKNSQFLYNPVCSLPCLCEVDNSAIAFIIRESGNGDLCVLLTKRVGSLRNHAGEVCLSGGKYEQSDQNLMNTALRETKEEVGISADDLQYISTLPPFFAGHSSSKRYAYFGATPVIFWLKRDVKLCLNTSEVEVAFWMPLDFCLRIKYCDVTYVSNPLSGARVDLVKFNFNDSVSQRTFLIYGCTANICVTVSSIALNSSPEFPFTGMGIYCHEQKLVIYEISRTTLNSGSHYCDWNYTPLVLKCKL